MRCGLELTRIELSKILVPLNMANLGYLFNIFNNNIYYFGCEPSSSSTIYYLINKSTEHFH